MTTSALAILGSHLFPPAHLDDWSDAPVFMAEDVGLCTYVRHHQQKLVLFLAAMRHHRDELVERGFDVTYHELDDRADGASYEDTLGAWLEEVGADELVTFEIEDRFFEQRLQALVDRLDIGWRQLPSPMFVTPRPVFAEYVDGANRPFMAAFYEKQRTRLGILLEDDGSPIGGQWSFDHDNRKKLPKKIDLPGLPEPTRTEHVDAVVELVRRRFADHPGDAGDFWLPVTRRSALAWYRRFLDERFQRFGDYEDAMTTRDPFVFHSVLTPALNLGLITPDEVIERALDHADEHEIPINALEGFVRQIIGWREFIRGIDRHFGEQQAEANHFGHERKLTEAWWTGDTGLDPLDHTIRTAQRWGWTHHIERLMIAGNLMTLCEVHPHEAYRWFMELYVDSSDWVMGPNVYGMGIFSDGGVFSTKPYVCGSNYVLKMSDFTKGDWCPVMDGLYWRFIARHRDFFESNPRLSMMPRMLDKLDGERRERIFGLAEDFIERVTTA